MGAATASGSISAEFINLPVEGVSDEGDAAEAIRSQVKEFLRNACSDWNSALGSVEVEISEFEGGDKLASIRFHNEVTVLVRYSEDEHDVTEWASENMAAIMASDDSNLDYTVEDMNDDSDHDNADYAVEDGNVTSQNDILMRRATSLEAERVILRDQAIAKDAQVADLTRKLAEAERVGLTQFNEEQAAADEQATNGS